MFSVVRNFNLTLPNTSNKGDFLVGIVEKSGVGEVQLYPRAQTTSPRFKEGLTLSLSSPTSLHSQAGFFFTVVRWVPAAPTSSQLQVQPEKDHPQQLLQKSQSLDHLPTPGLWPTEWEVKLARPDSRIAAPHLGLARPIPTQGPREGNQRKSRGYRGGKIPLQVSIML